LAKASSADARVDVRRLLVAECALHVRALILESVRADIILSNDTKGWGMGRRDLKRREGELSLTVHSKLQLGSG